MLRLAIPIGLLFLSLPLLSQIVLSDSIAIRLKSASSDSDKVVILLEYGQSIQQTLPARSLEVLFEALNRSRRIDSQELIQKSLMAVGSFLYYSGFHARSMEHFREYYDRAVQAGNLKQQLMARANFHSIKLVQAESFDDDLKNDMLELLREFENLWIETKDTNLVVQVIPGRWVNLALLCLQGNQIEEADEYLSNAEAYIDKAFPHMPLLLQMQIQLSRGVLLQRSGKFHEADSLFGSVHSFADENGMYQMAVSAIYYQAENYLMNGDTSAAEQRLNDVLAAGQKYGIQSFIFNASAALAEIYERSGDVDKALNALRIQNMAKDSIRDQEAAREIARAELEVRLKELEHSLKKKSDKTILRLTIAASISLFLLIIMGLFLLRNRRRARISQIEQLQTHLQTEQDALEKQALESKLLESDQRLTRELLDKLARQRNLGKAIQKLLDHLKSQRSDNKLIEEALRELRSSRDNEALKEFGTVFETIHSDFFSSLLTQFPTLTPNERRLCAFIHLKMSIREIGSITGQSTRAISLARTRLRRKMGLTHSDIDLDDFLSNLLGDGPND